LAAAIVFGIGGLLVAQEILEKAYHRSSEVIGKPSTSRGDNQGRVDERPDARRCGATSSVIVRHGSEA
jgi:hypothetical protein